MSVCRNCEEKIGGYCHGCMNNTVDTLTAQLAERDNKIKVLNEYCIQLNNSIVAASYVFGIDREPLAVVKLSSKKYAALRTKLAECEKEVERLNQILHQASQGNAELIGKVIQEARKQAAQEIIQYIIDQGMIDAGTVSRPMLVYEVAKCDIEELRQRYGLEG